MKIETYIAAHNIEAWGVLSCVGSLTHAAIRLANRSAHDEYGRHFEIVSLNGTVSVHGSHYSLISISDGDGKTIGGHLVSGCKNYTTMEIAASLTG